MPKEQMCATKHVQMANMCTVHATKMIHQIHDFMHDISS